MAQTEALVWSLAKKHFRKQNGAPTIRCIVTVTCILRTVSARLRKCSTSIMATVFYLYPRSQQKQGGCINILLTMAERTTRMQKLNLNWAILFRHISDFG